MPVPVASLIALGLVVAAVGVYLGRLVARRQAEAWSAGVRELSAAIQAAAAAERAEVLRGAKRIMGIAVGRFSGHYLTERLLSLLPLPQGAPLEALIGREEANLRAIEAVAGVKLSLTDGRDAIRLEGLDGVGREIA